PARRDDIGPMPDELRRQRGGQGQRRRKRQRRTRERFTRARTLACERGQLIARELDFFLVDIDLTLVLGQGRFGLAHFELRAEAALQTPTREFGDAFLLRERVLRDIEQRERLR